MSASGKIIEFWRKSIVYKIIDAKISKYFRKRMKNTDFTILCPNCIGGLIYHRLGMNFFTPTINMIINTHDFVPFCLHLEYYLEQDIVFTEGEKYPTGYLPGMGTEDMPDVHIIFNHDKVNEEARQKWERRKRRVNPENLYIVMYRWSGITKEELDKLDACKCKNKILLSKYEKPLVSWEHYIDPKGKDDNYLASDLFGVRYYEKKWDYIRFFNE